MSMQGKQTTVTADFAPAPGGVHTLRRVIAYSLLALFVSLAAVGVSGLIDELIPAPVFGDREIARSNTTLAQPLAFTLIAGPFGALVFWLVRRWLTSFNDRSSVLWPVYLIGMHTASLMVAAFALLGVAASAVRGDGHLAQLSTGVVWLCVWYWHRWLLRSASTSPFLLPDVTTVIAALFGLAVAVSSGIEGLTALIDAAIVGPPVTIVGETVWVSQLSSSAVWCAGGGVLWWLHWFADGVRLSTRGFARFALVVVAGFASVAIALGGLTTALYVGLATLATNSDVLDELARAIANLAAGAALWAYYRTVVREASDGVREAVRIVSSGVSLVFAASGLGVVVNALLSSFTEPLVSSGPSLLLFGGLSALVVGGVAWWAFWRPRGIGATDHDSPVPDAATSAGGRRIYLVVVFGVSTLIAVITLLVIAYEVFTFLLSSFSTGSLIDNIRAPLGLLTATLLVAAYHFALWRSDRAATVAAGPEASSGVARITLVASDPRGELRAELARATGASVTLLRTAEPTEPTDATMVAAAIAAVSAQHVLVVARGAQVEVIPLAE
ncbi:hypothetical protein DF220_11925 [Salinibacterium hongtaonis]|uniref:DUF5671 domain-containing protein n=1 Tax=Homoserinimonas hongtaonis TaxID=2079791 RepID=A0A2U1SWW2_9MICO|nr:hypothetical protein DF220_11925 [Salinibacterium hongtaonis]